jgi:hypothetical protein
MSEEPAGVLAAGKGFRRDWRFGHASMGSREAGERFGDGGFPILGWVEHVASFGGLNSAPTYVNTFAG